ncbi:MAG: alanine racemase [Clostridia bacterium]|nr:alanine racemase [Clostridia bacterium]
MSSLKQAKNLRSWVEVDLEQIELNYKIYRSHLPSDTDIIAVVKADAYGHGAVPVAKRLAGAGVKRFAVATLDEAIELRRGGIKGEILVLGYTAPALAGKISRYKVTQAIVSEEHAEELLRHKRGKLSTLFAINTGMNRIGLSALESENTEHTVRRYYKELGARGIFTHLAVAGSPRADDVEYTERQLDSFGSLLAALSDLNLTEAHALNSIGGLIYGSDTRGGEAVRLGIVLYGLLPREDFVLPKGIHPVLTWKTTASSVFKVKAGESIGYSRSYIAKRDSIIATLTTGYADGYPRLLSGRADVLVNGRRARVVGNICMDQMMIDVSDVGEVRTGDEVILIGRSGDEVITADELASRMGTIGYEIVAGISKRVERICIN